MVKSIDYGRFIKSEDIYRGLYVENGAICRAIIQFGFFCQRDDTFRHFIGIISDSRFKRYLRQNKTKSFFFFIFPRFLSLFNQLPRSATLIYGITFPGSGKMHSTSSAGWIYCLCFNLRHGVGSGPVWMVFKMYRSGIICNRSGS